MVSYIGQFGKPICLQSRGILDSRKIAITGQCLPILMVCKILCVAGEIGLCFACQTIRGRAKIPALIRAFCNARWIPGIGGSPGGDLVLQVASRLRPMPIYAHATTRITPSEEKGIQLKDNTSTLSAVLLRADSQLGVVKKIGRLSPPIHSSRGD